MKRFSIFTVIFLLGLLLSDIAGAQQVCGPNGCTSGAGLYAARLNAGRIFRHDPAFQGAEVIYKSSGEATEAEARQWWMNSPAHRQLLVSGAIQEIACVGGVCVGRSAQAVTNVTQAVGNGVQAGYNKSTNLKPVKRLRSILRCR